MYVSIKLLNETNTDQFHPGAMSVTSPGMDTSQNGRVRFDTIIVTGNLAGLLCKLDTLTPHCLKFTALRCDLALGDSE